METLHSLRTLATTYWTTQHHNLIYTGHIIYTVMTISLLNTVFHY
jgi:hypothetical protein